MTKKELIERKEKIESKLNTYKSTFEYYKKEIDYYEIVLKSLIEVIKEFK